MKERHEEHASDQSRDGIPADAYERLVQASPQGMLYCHRWWLDAVCPGRYEIIYVEEHGELQAAWPVVWRRSLGARWIAMPPLTQKLGILYAHSEAKYAEQLSREHRHATALIKSLPTGTRIWGHHFHESFSSWLPFFWAGCRQTTRYTYCLPDTSKPDEIWSGMRSSVRTKIRKAEKAGLRIRETEDLEEFYRIQCMTYARQSAANPVTFDLIERVYGACKEHIGVRITVAEDKSGRAHAAEFTPYDSKCMVALMAGGDPALRGSGAGDLLIWDAIQFAGTVCSRFDFEGSMRPSIEPFFRGFGAQITPYSRISGVLRNKPIGSIRRHVGEAFRRIGDFVG